MFNRIYFLIFALTFLGYGFARANTNLLLHDYQDGESYNYYLEDSEAIYSTEQVGKLPRVKELMKIQELQLNLSIKVLQSNRIRTIKQVTITEAKYRELDKDVVDASLVPFVPVETLIPLFPKNFTFKYDEGDTRLIEQMSTVFATYLSNPVAMFLYYKMIDAFTFQALYEDGKTVPQSMKVGSVNIAESTDSTNFAQGKFHNHSPLAIYQRNTKKDKVNQAYIKILTMGNYYEMPDTDVQLDSNYQLSFYVPLEGIDTGLVTSGELLETGYYTPKGKPTIVIQRQLSLTMSR